MIYFLLILATVMEVVATLLLKASHGWEKWWFGMGSIFFYVIAGIVFAIVLKAMNVGIAYTIWSGVGIALVCVSSVFIWQQKFDLYAIMGIIMIVAGSLLITLKSSTIIE